MRAVPTVFLIAGTLLAGCSGGGSEAATTGPALPTVSVDPGAATGAIGGVVVDDSIRTIIGATVRIEGAGLAAVTDGQGAFIFEDLAPGTYFLTGNATGFLPSQTSVDVVAGQVATARLQLRASHDPTPYHLTVPFTGFIEVWFGYAQFYTEQVVPVCECYLTVTPDANNLTGIVFEAIWEDTTPRPTGLEDDQWYWDTFYDPASGGRLDAGYCASPCRAEIPVDEYEGGEILFMLQGPDFYVTFEQTFDMYVTLFYNGPIPEGWSLVAGSA